MRKKNTESLKDVLVQVLKQQRLEKPLNEKRLIDAWPLILGDSIAKYTSDIKINNKIMFVTMTSSVIRHELFMSRQDIIKKLNNHIGTEIISEIIFK